MKLKKIFPIACAICLACMSFQPVLAIKGVQAGNVGPGSTSEIDEGTITNLAKQQMMKRLQMHLSSSQGSKIDKEYLNMGNQFDYFPEDSKINLTLKDVDVASILRIIAKEGGMNIVIDESVLGFISAELKDISLNEAMEIILVSEELEARVNNNTIFVASRPVMAKKGLNRRFIKTFKLNNSDAYYIADILKASVFNKGYKVNEEAESLSGAALPSITPYNEAYTGTSGSVEGEGSVSAEGSSTGQSNLIDGKVIKGKIETLQSGSGFGNAGELASNIVVQHNSARTGDIIVDNNDGGAIVIPDTRTNSILVAGLKQDIMLAKEAIEYLDKPLKQVSIEVSLIELTKGDTKDLGLSSAIQGSKTMGGFNSLSTDGDFNGYDFISTSSQSGIMFNSIDKLNDQLALKLNAKLFTEEAKLLANPTIVALNGSESLIKITEQVVTSVETTVTTTAITYSAELSDVGIVLNLLPKIGDDGNITMRVRPSITSALPEVLIGETVNNNAAIRITPISTREVILQDVRVKSGETLAIAGLTKEKDTEKVGRLPILGDIPVIGRLFSNTEHLREVNELIILITPTIIDDIAQL